MAIKVKKGAYELAVERISKPDEQEWITVYNPTKDEPIDIEQTKNRIKEKYGHLLRKN